MVHEPALLLDVADHPGIRAVHIPHGGLRAGDQHQEHPDAHRAGRQVLLGDLVFAFPALQ